MSCQLDHSEYIREAENASTAVLLIHGIAGTPAHFRQLIPVIPTDWSIYNLLLDGHGGAVRDFSATSMKKWKAQVAARLEQLLNRYEAVYLVAHSMGTLFSIQAAIAHPDQIKGLFLLAVPTRPWVRFTTMCTCLRVSFGNIKPTDTSAIAMQNATSICLTSRLWAYIGWIPRMLELLSEIRKTRKLLPGLTVPTMSFQSKVDELVSARSIRDMETHPVIQNTVLHHSGHFAYGDEDMKLLQTRLKRLLK